MARVTVSIDIPKPIAAVWDEAARLDRHAGWMADAEHIEFLDGRHSGVGTAMRVRTRIGPIVLHDDITVEEWIEPRLIAVSHSGLVSGTGSFIFEPIDGGTRFRWHEELRFPWYLGGAITAFFARPVLRWIWRGNLKRFAESVC
jgi:Polyketide cyclase / dehydrase and lipid transport